MRPLPLPLLLLLSLLSVGCGVHSPRKVHKLAGQAEVDPRKLDRLIRGLESRDEATWQEAYGVLVEMGLPASGALQDAVLRRSPGAGRCILVLGEMGEPTNFPFLRDALAVPELRPYAHEAFAIAEDLLAARMVEEREIGLCDAYLEWYPEGRKREEAVLLRRDLLAAQAWSRLGRKPSVAELRAFLERYGDTPTGRRARAELANRLLVEAGKELARHRLDESLALVLQAREVEPGAATDAMEAAVRRARGQEAMEALRMDSAVRELEQACALSDDPELRSLLGRAHLERARRSFLLGSPQAAMADLQQAERLEPATRGSTQELRRQWVEQLFEQLEGAYEPPEGVVEALVMAGLPARPRLETAIQDALILGDPTSLERAIDASSSLRGTGSEPSARWCGAIVEQALSDAEGDVQLLLAHPPAQQALFEPDNFVSPEYARIVEDAARVLRRYVAVVGAAHYHQLRLGPVRGPLPASPPMLETDVADLFAAGHDGRDALGLPPLTRAQLMLYQVNRINRLHGALRDHLASVVAEILEGGLVPFQLNEWVRVLGEADLRGQGMAQRSALRDGTPIRVLSSREGGLLSITLVVLEPEVLGPSPALPDAWIGDALGVVFALARPAMAADPGLQRIEVKLGLADGPAATAVVEDKLELGFSRRSVARIDWEVVEGERPYGRDHLALIPDHKLR
jgi:tetratricopeptide (TPR) repeat protein